MRALPIVASFTTRQPRNDVVFQFRSGFGRHGFEPLGRLLYYIRTVAITCAFTLQDENVIGREIGHFES